MSPLSHRRDPLQINYLIIISPEHGFATKNSHWALILIKCSAQQGQEFAMWRFHIGGQFLVQTEM